MDTAKKKKSPPPWCNSSPDKYLGELWDSHSAIPSGKSPVVFAVSEECVKPSTPETDRDTLQQAELSAAHPYDSFSFSRA